MAGANRIVIIGGGFGGINAAKALKRAPVEVTLLDRRNFHLFQPLLYQVATGGLSPADIASPIRALFRKQKNTRVLLSEVTDIDLAGKLVKLAGGGDLPYDSLIVAAGAGHTYFGHDEWAPFAPPLKSLEDATGVRSRILRAFENAEAAQSQEERLRWLTFVIVGGGPTGVEMAGAMGELAHHTLTHDFRTFDPRSARILLIENSDRILNSYHEKLALRAQKDLIRLGVTVKTGFTVANVTGDSVLLKNTGGSEEDIHAGTVIWAAGVKASPLGAAICKGAGVQPADRAGRVPVGADLTVPGHPEVIVIGDLASVKGRDGKPLRGTADVAQQQGSYAGKAVRARLLGRAPKPFKFFDLGTLAVIGRSSAVVDLRWIRLTGFAAWWLWLFLHIMKLVDFDNRASVMLQWGYSFITRDCSARLITGNAPAALPPVSTTPLSLGGRG